MKKAEIDFNVPYVPNKLDHLNSNDNVYHFKVKINWTLAMDE